ncbi:hypothetical protein FOMPIDRAFT_1158916 [Fomitopsis schrenkii]|uniref:Uncharacterized protein n=1 Tax=Fomitopsis schrenkii TaxID=2126942 RepID=S8FYY6_FOMSC|nr:hypothetical protein FOMPIDRAFT_1158916 [Fomitopsis schrenkii]
MQDNELHLRSRLTLLLDALSRFQEFLKFTGGIITTIILIFVSWLVKRPLGDHHLNIGRSSIRNLSLYDVCYTGALYDEKYTYTFTAPCISIRFCRPTSAYPCWLVFTAHELFYKSTTCDTSLTRLDVSFWVFPYLFKRTAGSWISAELDGLRIRVHHSNETPYWVKRLRQNLAAALLNGDIYRLDDVKVTVRFAGCTDREADGSSPADHVDPPPPFLNREVDELRTTISASQLHLHNPDARIYAFHAIDAQLRRDWDSNRGSFVLIAEESRWIRVRSPYQGEWSPGWRQIFTSLAQFPFDFLRFIDFPMSAVDLYVGRADVTFDEFRIRDAELVKQGFITLREKTALFEVNWGDAILDAFIKTVVNP